MLQKCISNRQSYQVWCPQLAAAVSSGCSRSVDAGRSLCLMSGSHLVSLTDFSSCQSAKTVTQSEPVERSHSVPWRRNTLPPLAFSGGVIVGAAVGNSVVSAAMNERECIHLFSLWWGCESWNGARLPTWQLLFPREISCPVVYRIAQCHYSLAIIAIVQSTLTS